MHQCGEGAHLAGRRREVNWQVEAAMRADREREWVSRVRGPIVSRGRFFRQ